MAEKKERSDSTRRDFVKTAGLTLVAAAIGGAAGSYLSKAPLGEIPTLRPVGAKARAILFDIGGTTLDWSVMPDKITKFLADRGVTVDGKSFWPAWRGKIFAYMMYNSLISAGFISLEELGKRATMALAKTMKLDIKPGDVGGILPLLGELDVYPDVKPGLNRMRELGYQLVAHTQLSTDILKRGLLDRQDIKYDWYSTSDMWGLYKPHRDIYLKPIQAMGVDRSEVIFVTSNQFDIFGSKGVGFRTAWVNRWNETLEPYGYAPDWQVKDFVELAKVLEAEKS